MPLAVQNAAPSTLAVVIGQVIDAFQAMGDSTPILVGSAYLSGDNVGEPPRILFVPETRGKVEFGALEMGRAGRITHSCDVYVRAAEGTGDLARFDAAYVLGDLVIACLHTAAPGRIDGGEYADDSPAETDSFGADLMFSFTYARDVPLSAARAALPPASADSSAAGPLIPPGTGGTVDSVTPTTTPPEE